MMQAEEVWGHVRALLAKGNEVGACQAVARSVLNIQEQAAAYHYILEHIRRGELAAKLGFELSHNKQKLWCHGRRILGVRLEHIKSAYGPFQESIRLTLQCETDYVHIRHGSQDDTNAASMEVGMWSQIRARLAQGEDVQACAFVAQAAITLEVRQAAFGYVLDQVSQDAVSAAPGFELAADHSAMWCNGRPMLDVHPQHLEYISGASGEYSLELLCMGDYGAIMYRK